MRAGTREGVKGRDKKYIYRGIAKRFSHLITTACDTRPSLQMSITFFFLEERKTPNIKNFLQRPKRRPIQKKKKKIFSAEAHAARRRKQWTFFSFFDPAFWKDGEDEGAQRKRRKKKQKKKQATKWAASKQKKKERMSWQWTTALTGETSDL